MIMYDDISTILEAMEIDPALGGVDWVAGYHVRDAMALAEAAFWSQVHVPSWKSQVYGDPFARELERWQDELMIEPAKSSRSRLVEPSYFTWRPGIEYIVETICAFFNSLGDGCKVEWRKVKSSYGWSANATSYRVLLVESSSRRGEKPARLLEIPGYHSYSDHAQLKAELMRYLFVGLERAIEKRWIWFRSDRKPFFDAMRFVDDLWGVPPLP